MPNKSLNIVAALMIGMFSILSSKPAHAQNLIIDSLSVTQVTYSCSTTVGTANLYLGCTNYLFSSTSINISGSNINVDITYTSSPICFGAITYPTQTVNFGNIPPGKYKITTATILGTTLTSSVSDSITVIDCCPNAAFQSSFTMSDSVICLDDSVICTNTGAGNLLSYKWLVNGVVEDSTTNFVANFSSKGSYIITLRVDSANSCTRILDRTVTVKKAPSLDLGNDKLFCVGDSAVLNAGLGWDTLLWSTSANTQSIVVRDSGQYTLIASDTGNCGFYYDTVHVTHKPTPVVDFGNDTALCPGAQLVLIATNAGATYKWQDNSAAPAYTVTKAGSYWAKATFSNNCSATDTIHITYDGCIGLEEYSKTDLHDVLPNPFSDRIYINLNSSITPTRVTLHDITGQRIIDVNYSTIQDGIDVSSLKSGVYLLNVQYDHAIKVHRLVKNSNN